ncbi:helicase DnaB [Streptomyces sp. NBC_01335]|uniref:DnaB-like helicase N-terminal domain-containing protein n=1 Tax=Streptomyces sp. NBC_01335 TaxID=2903828 RepID=UPI002E10A946|nr:helicase DnaB [Streptomyces sp. NBC_01335]
MPVRKLQEDDHPALTAEKAVPLSWVTDTVKEAGHHVRGLTPVYAHTLISACPRPEHAAVYGRMVLEGAIHRSITEHAIRLHQAARADAVQGEVAGALHQADVLHEVLGDLAQRWGTDPQPVAPPAPATATAPLAPPAVRGQDEDEQFLLAVLADQPGGMDDVVGWLRPEDFARPVHGQIYRCLGALHHRGEPIDRVTLLWEAQRRGLLADGALTEKQLTALCDGAGAGNAGWLGRQVVRAAVTRTAATSAHTIKVLAEDAALAPGRLISHALHALGPLDDIRTRWHAAHLHPDHPAPGPSPNEPPPVRAHAALARSTLRPSTPPPTQTSTTPVSATPRSPSRGHS